MELGKIEIHFDDISLSAIVNGMGLTMYSEKVIGIRTAQKRQNHITIMVPSALGDTVHALKDALTRKNRLRAKEGKERFSYEINIFGLDPRPEM